MYYFIFEENEYALQAARHRKNVKKDAHAKLLRDESLPHHSLSTNFFLQSIYES